MRILAVILFLISVAGGIAVGIWAWRLDDPFVGILSGLGCYYILRRLSLWFTRTVQRYRHRKARRLTAK